MTEPPKYAPYGQRVGSALLELFLFGACLGIGWIVWWVVLWPRGGSPARSVLHLHLVQTGRGEAPTTKATAARELLAKGLFPLAPISAAFVLFSASDQGLWDRAAGTRVVRSAAVASSGGRLEEAPAEDAPVLG